MCIIHWSHINVTHTKQGNYASYSHEYDAHRTIHLVPWSHIHVVHMLCEATCVAYWSHVYMVHMMFEATCVAHWSHMKWCTLMKGLTYPRYMWPRWLTEIIWIYSMKPLRSLIGSLKWLVLFYTTGYGSNHTYELHFIIITILNHIEN